MKLTNIGKENICLFIAGKREIVAPKASIDVEPAVYETFKGLFPFAEEAGDHFAEDSKKIVEEKPAKEPKAKKDGKASKSNKK